MSAPNATRGFRFKVALARTAKLVIALLLTGGFAWAMVLWGRAFSEGETSVGMTHRISRGDLVVTIEEQGILESEDNVEIKSKVRGYNAVLWIIENGSFVNQGDELVRLDSLSIQEQVDERTKFAHWSKSGADQSAAALARARLAVDEYDQGRYRTEVLSLEKDIAVSRAALRNARDRYQHSLVMASSGFISALEIEERQFATQQAVLALELKEMQLKVLRNFTYKEELQTLRGELAATEANHKANVERAMADASRRDRAVEELRYCVIRAERGGLVIHPNAAQWESAPIAEGTNVHKDQVLLLMPDLDKMRGKLGVHESLVKRVREGQTAEVTLSEGVLPGSVSEVASIAKPAGWWTGNQVRYDTYISLPPREGLRPGMSAEVVIAVAEYENVLLMPVAAVVEDESGAFCWVRSSNGACRTRLALGDTNGVFQIVTDGVREGDEVLLNPAALEQSIRDDTRSGPPDPKGQAKVSTEGSEP